MTREGSTFAAVLDQSEVDQFSTSGPDGAAPGWAMARPIDLDQVDVDHRSIR
jgi:hypothetical protein